MAAMPQQQQQQQQQQADPVERLAKLRAAVAAGHVTEEEAAAVRKSILQSF